MTCPCGKPARISGRGGGKCAVCVRAARRERAIETQIERQYQRALRVLRARRAL